MKYTSHQRNTPIVTLLKNYTNKKSGKVTESRDEIQKRFDYLDWKDQKKIIRAFLESGKSDRQWGYAKALDYWDKAFEPIIKELWEQFHERKCSWVITRHFPIEYLQQHIEQFSVGRDYHFICLRLAKDKDFVIQKEKLSPTDYLSVLHHTGRSIQEDEANDILQKIVHNMCVKEFSIYENPLDPYVEIDKGSIISPIRFRDVSLAIYYLKKLNCDFVASQFEEWNDRIEKTIYNSPEYKAICQSDLSIYDYQERAIPIAQKYAYMALNDSYKQASDPSTNTALQEIQPIETTPKKQEENTSEAEVPITNDPAILKEMIAKNPTLERLIGDFGLDAEESPLPF